MTFKGGFTTKLIKGGGFLAQSISFFFKQFKKKVTEGYDGVARDTTVLTVGDAWSVADPNRYPSHWGVWLSSVPLGSAD